MDALAARIDDLARGFAGLGKGEIPEGLPTDQDGLKHFFARECTQGDGQLADYERVLAAALEVNAE